jgi:hypothetical protein
MNFETITQTDISLIKHLDALIYPNNTIVGVVDAHEEAALKLVRNKFQVIADNIEGSFGSIFGPFHIENTNRNPVGMRHKLRRVWSCVFKGNTNKQYAAQIITGIDPITETVDIGFSFGQAAAKIDDPERKATLEDRLHRLGQIMHEAIVSNQAVLIQLNGLLDMGFKCQVEGKLVNLEEWIANLLINPKFSSIIIRLSPEQSGVVNAGLMKYYITACIPLMSIFPFEAKSDRKGHKFLPRPRTPEERALEAELRTRIGIRGEIFALDYEKKKLARLKLVNKDYPQHVAAVSDAYHYDILSLDKIGKIHIEVKTTARLYGDPYAEICFMSAGEYQFFQDHPRTYRLYRVYDIFGQPSLMEINPQNILLETEGYRIKILSDHQSK